LKEEALDRTMWRNNFEKALDLLFDRLLMMMTSYNTCWLSGDRVLQNMKSTVDIIGISSPQKLLQFQSYIEV
jgi:hypothetical protein